LPEKSRYRDLPLERFFERQTSYSFYADEADVSSLPEKVSVGDVPLNTRVAV
jgi:hypothetical protein